MAQAIGGDILLELMATTARLEESTEKQSAKLTELAKSVNELAADAKVNAGHLARMAKLLGSLAKVVNDRFDEVDARLQRLEAASGK
jgi:methyl-accepting chemotaxis protein